MGIAHPFGDYLKTLPVDTKIELVGVRQKIVPDDKPHPGYDLHYLTVAVYRSDSEQPESFDYGTQKILDWDTAAQLIREGNPKLAQIRHNAEWCKPVSIYADGKPLPDNSPQFRFGCRSYTPQLVLDGKAVDCWVYEMETDGWTAKTFWPNSALKILNNSESRQASLGV